MKNYLRLTALALLVLLQFSACSSCKKDDVPSPANNDIAVSYHHIKMGLYSNNNLPHFLAIRKGSFTLYGEGKNNASSVDLIVSEYSGDHSLMILSPSNPGAADGWAVKRGTNLYEAGNNDARWMDGINFNEDISRIKNDKITAKGLWLWNYKVGDCFIVETEDNVLAAFRITNISGNTLSTNGNIEFDFKVQN